MPRTLTHRAEEVLAQLEASRGGAGDAAVDRPKLAVADAAPAGYGENSEGMQLSFFQLDDPVLAQVRDTILSINIDHLTPVEALLKLHEIRKAVGGN
jgi:DNA mismatch repair protein MutS